MTGHLVCAKCFCAGGTLADVCCPHAPNPNGWTDHGYSNEPGLEPFLWSLGSRAYEITATPKAGGSPEVFTGTVDHTNAFGGGGIRDCTKQVFTQPPGAPLTYSMGVSLNDLIPILGSRDAPGTPPARSKISMVIRPQSGIGGLTRISLGIEEDLTPFFVLLGTSNLVANVQHTTVPVFINNSPRGLDTDFSVDWTDDDPTYDYVGSTSGQIRLEYRNAFECGGVGP